jgi:hypothetical protein
MLLALLPRITRSLSIDTPANNINLYESLDSPVYPLNAICVINANVSSTNIYNAAFRTGQTWPISSFVYVVNNSNIVGAPGEATYGTSGVGGAGGAGATDAAASTAGSAGGNGLDGYISGNGGIALRADSNTGITLLFDNTRGNIIAGYAGVSFGSTGGGGGGGGGGSNA